MAQVLLQTRQNSASVFEGSGCLAFQLRDYFDACTTTLCRFDKNSSGVVDGIAGSVLDG